MIEADFSGHVAERYRGDEEALVGMSLRRERFKDS